MVEGAIAGNPGDKKLLLGNEAIARGALEAGISIASSYPGTPSTEILESLIDVAEQYGIYVEWSTNEKVALEVGIGASMSGLRALVTMKHVGVNVAADALMSLGYTGVIGGLILVSADDPGAFSSQNEQDNRIYGIHSYIPVFEPSEPQEAKNMVVDLYDLSEKYSSAIILRSTTRLSHTRGVVILGEIRRGKSNGLFNRKPRRWTLLPPHNKNLHREAVERIEKLSEELHSFRYNFLKRGEDNLAIVSGGVAYTYVAESIKKLGLKPHILKLASTYPLPRKLIRELFDLNPDKIVIVEELEPIIEHQLKVLAFDERFDGEIVGKEIFPRIDELTTLKVMEGLSRVLKLEINLPTPLNPSLNIPPRPPTFCPGCGHRSVYFAVKLAVKRLRVDAIFPNDIGCYTLGFFSPFVMADLSWSMGSSIGIGSGIARFSKKRPVIAFIGDSTFFHAGIPALLNAVYNSYPLVIVVMDNLVTAMTGHQPHPGSGAGALGDPRKRISIEDIVKASGIEFVEVIDAYNISMIRSTTERAIKYVSEKSKPAVIVARRPCALVFARLARREGRKLVPYYIDLDRCVKCGICVNDFACPAITVFNDTYQIQENICIGCGVCTQICPAKAIKRIKG